MSIQCFKCGYSVTEPICASCVINEIQSWLHEQPIEKEAITKINGEFKSLLRQIGSLDYVLIPSKNLWKISIMKCIKCKKEMTLMCFYCVSNQAHKIVKSNLRTESLMKSFSSSFNTNFYDSEFNKLAKRV